MDDAIRMLAERIKTALMKAEAKVEMLKEQLAAVNKLIG